jgi:hypothetical protein
MAFSRKIAGPYLYDRTYKLKVLSEGWIITYGDGLGLKAGMGLF